MNRVKREARSDPMIADKEPFQIDEVFVILRKAVAGFPKAAMFDLRDRGFDSPFEQLVGSLISSANSRRDDHRGLPPAVLEGTHARGIDGPERAGTHEPPGGSDLCRGESARSPGAGASDRRGERRQSSRVDGVDFSSSAGLDPRSPR